LLLPYSRRSVLKKGLVYGDLAITVDDC